MSSGFRGDVGSLISDRAFIGYVLCQVLASQIIFTFAGGGPYIVVTQMGRTSAEYGAWFATTGFAYLVGNLFCVRFAPRHSLEKLIWFGLALQFGGALLNLVWSITGTQPGAVMAVRHPDDRDGRQRLRDVNSAAGAISVRPEAAGTASGAMGFLQHGHRRAGLAIRRLSRRPLHHHAAADGRDLRALDRLRLDDVLPGAAGDVVVSEELIEKAEEEERGCCEAIASIATPLRLANACDHERREAIQSITASLDTGLLRR